ncbi:PHA/PHB synthase family protein [Alsobacter metallidurans]|uniref:PHA/PHB synthase family protein n=1 Tax=Alsobacter metallidurans TaxID=340221 RepID=UPI00166604BB|nr:alpha/beta fold hydrolase [Alsobacter metallidurans]
MTVQGKVGATQMRHAPVEPAGIATSAAFDENPADRLLHAAIGNLCWGFSPIGLAEAWMDWAMHLAISPARGAEIGASWTREAGRLAALNISMLLNSRECEPGNHSLPQDRRFRSLSWGRWPFAIFAESLLALERGVDEATRDIHGPSEHHLALLRFVGRQLLDCMAPSNSPLTNPEVLEATVQSRGANLLAGAGIALDDWRRLATGTPPAGADAFRPGETVARTRGRVILQNRLVEVIQYEPTTELVQPQPVVIVPAWIMKYYVLDLQPHNSLVKHLVDEGFTVYMISWKNPDESDRDLRLDDYRTLGVLPALATALEASNARRAHLVGYCIGGTLAAITAAAMARDADNRLQSLTLLAAQTDFREAGELSLFINDSQISILEDMMLERGVLDASRMAGTFHLLRSNDLIWSRMIHQYLLGEREPVGDIAAWAADATRMPAAMHSEYLRKLYLNNDLVEGRLAVGSDLVSLHDIHVPIFAVGTEWDHVAPWRSVFKVHGLTQSEVTFVLTNGGHNQGIVSPPGRTDRHFRVATSRPQAPHLEPEHWLRDVAVQNGSWWPFWFAWLTQHGQGERREPPVSGRGPQALVRAPGRYVLG